MLYTFSFDPSFFYRLRDELDHNEAIRVLDFVENHLIEKDNILIFQQIGTEIINNKMLKVINNHAILEQNFPIGHSQWELRNKI